MKFRYAIIGLTLASLPGMAAAADPCRGEQTDPMALSPEFEMRARPTEEKDFDEYVEYLIEVADPLKLLIHGDLGSRPRSRGGLFHRFPQLRRPQRRERGSL